VALMTDAVATLPTATDGFLLQRVQPALSGLIDGSLSSLAPIFAVVLATHTPRYAFFARERAWARYVRRRSRNCRPGPDDRGTLWAHNGLVTIRRIELSAIPLVSTDALEAAATNSS
jgi:hypothetical protein